MDLFFVDEKSLAYFGVAKWEQFDADPNKNLDLADVNLFDLSFFTITLPLMQTYVEIGILGNFRHQPPYCKALPWKWIWMCCFKIKTLQNVALDWTF